MVVLPRRPHSSGGRNRIAESFFDARFGQGDRSCFNDPSRVRRTKKLAILDQQAH